MVSLHQIVVKYNKLYYSNNSNWLIVGATSGIDDARFFRHGDASSVVKNIKVGTVMNVKPKLLDQVRAKIRLKHYSIRTEQAYVDWIRRYILFHDKRHPQEIGRPEGWKSTSAGYATVSPPIC